MDRGSCPLTSAEYESLLLVSQGCTYQQAAGRRGVSPSTIRTLLHRAYQRLDVSNVIQAATMMLREGWMRREDLLPDYAGSPYSTEPQHNKHAENWLPSPAQRLYLDAFDELLRERSEEAARAVDFAFGVLCWERGCPDRRRDARDVDELLLGLGLALTRPIPVAA